MLLTQTYLVLELGLGFSLSDALSEEQARGKRKEKKGEGKYLMFRTALISPVTLLLLMVSCSACHRGGRPPAAVSVGYCNALRDVRHAEAIACMYGTELLGHICWSLPATLSLSLHFVSADNMRGSIKHNSAVLCCHVCEQKDRTQQYR